MCWLVAVVVEMVDLVKGEALFVIFGCRLRLFHSSLLALCVLSLLGRHSPALPYPTP